jgi:hypothetical protein
MVMLVAAALLVLAMAAPAAFAVSPQQEECKAAGGTFSNPPGPGSSCIIVEETNPGQPKGEKAATPFETEMTETQPGQGGGEGNTNQRTKMKGETTNPGGGTPGGQQ